jgi:small subunit ribosomal protein S6
MAKTNTPASDMRAYELTYLIPGSYTDSEASKVEEAVNDLYKRYGAADIKTEKWGKKKMAYRIKKGGVNHQEAYYLHTKFNLASDKTQAFEMDVYLQPQVIRHLLVLAEEDKATSTSKTAASE